MNLQSERHVTLYTIQGPNDDIRKPFPAEPEEEHSPSELGCNAEAVEYRDWRGRVVGRRQNDLCQWDRWPFDARGYIFCFPGLGDFENFYDLHHYCDESGQGHMWLPAQAEDRLWTLSVPEGLIKWVSLSASRERVTPVRDWFYQNPRQIYAFKQKNPTHDFEIAQALIPRPINQEWVREVSHAMEVLAGAGVGIKPPDHLLKRSREAFARQAGYPEIDDARSATSKNSALWKQASEAVKKAKSADFGERLLMVLERIDEKLSGIRSLLAEHGGVRMIADAI